ncbi:Penicillin-binding Protein dimerisation domain-containing protein, partial [Sporomusa acidovorans]
MWGTQENSRLKVMAVILFMIVTAIISRLVWLQILHGEDFRAQSDNNRIRLLSITAPRGTFYDRNGVPLVTSRPGFSVSLVPISGPISDEVINRLAPLVNMTAENIKKKIKSQDNPLAPIRIKDDVSQDILAKITERQSELPGVVVEVQAVRNYINQELAAHLFGYVGEISDTELEKKKSEGYHNGDLVGKSGLEKVYDKEIRGV